MSEKKEILLETGTGELEILEFIVGRGSYAINVIKIKEILEVGSISPVPRSNPAILGLAMVRGDVIPVIDMNFVLNGSYTSKTSFKTLLCEFNHIKVAFCVDEVKGIHRIPWAQIKKPDQIASSEDTLVIGNISFDDRLVMLLDFEKVVTDIAPSTGINNERIENIKVKGKRDTKVVLSDDSPLIRKLLLDALTKAGFSNLKFFDDGKQAWDYFENLVDEKKEDFAKEVDILITDIEMPQMDGHTLTRKIKEHPLLRSLPVIIFSSLITETLKHKGDSVKADAQLSKPEVDVLVDVIDKLLENR